MQLAGVDSWMSMEEAEDGIAESVTIVNKVELHKSTAYTRSASLLDPVPLYYYYYQLLWSFLCKPRAFRQYIEMDCNSQSLEQLQSYLHTKGWKAPVTKDGNGGAAGEDGTLQKEFLSIYWRARYQRGYCVIYIVSSEEGMLEGKT